MEQKPPMTWRKYLLLALLGLAVVTLVASFQHSPGYMDADYYYAGGIQLDEGYGFTEPYLWNYLDDPVGIPHPSNAYWMPLASIVAAAGLRIFEYSAWVGARIGFLLVGMLIPPLTAALAWSFTSRADLSYLSGLLAVFPVFYLPFIPITDTFGMYILLGGLFFLALNHSPSNFNSICIGLIAGLMHLARADGLFWLLIALISIFLFHKTYQSTHLIFPSVVFILAGYLLVMTPWYIRNITTFDKLLAPGGSRMLWLTSYNQMFSYPASQVTITAWWHSGLSGILQDRAWSLGLNLSNLLSVQGEVFLLPLIGFGFWHRRKDQIVKLAGIALLGLLAVMTLVFPFAGARGGFFHSGAALQTVWWVLAPVGLDRFIVWGVRKRGWNAEKAGRVFGSSLVAIAALLTFVIVFGRLIGSGGQIIWDRENDIYSRISAYLVSKGMTNETVVMVANPPGFYLASGRKAVAVPDGDLNTVISIAHRYQIDFLILENEKTPSGLIPIYNNPQEWQGLVFLGEVESARVYFIPR
jgi:hypothetical protein